MATDQTRMDRYMKLLDRISGILGSTDRGDTDTARRRRRDPGRGRADAPPSPEPAPDSKTEARREAGCHVGGSCNRDPGGPGRAA